MISPQNAARLSELGANAVFRSVGPQFEEDELTGKARVCMVPVLNSKGEPIMEEFVDRNGKPVYKPTGVGPDGKPTEPARELRPKRRADTGYVECDIIDRQQNPPNQNGLTLRYTSYATGRGDTEEKALEDALTKAEKAQKPLTAAQQADLRAGRIIDPVAAIKIRELEAELAKLRAEKPTQVKRPNTF